MSTSSSAPSGYRWQRSFDIVVAIAVGVLFSPVVIVAAAAIKLTSPGPVLYRARRVGRLGREFDVFKLRSMRSGAVGPAITAASDARITPVGRWVRLTKIDELPQVINVVRGEMSVVGPRPEDPRYVAEYDDAQSAILGWRPGITSPASLAFRHEEALLAAAEDPRLAYREIMAAKIRIDLDYVQRASLVGDLGVILDTIRAIFRSRPDVEPTQMTHPVEPPK